jgi:hypothetical protein
MECTYWYYAFTLGPLILHSAHKMVSEIRARKAEIASAQNSTR